MNDAVNSGMDIATDIAMADDRDREAACRTS